MSIHAQLSRMTQPAPQPSAKASAPAPISPSEDAGVPLSDERLAVLEYEHSDLSPADEDGHLIAELIAEVRRLRAVEAQSLATPQPPREGEIHPDTVRLDTAQRLLRGCDFAWGDPDAPRSVVVLDIPQGVRVGADFRAFLDAATPEGRTDA